MALTLADASRLAPLEGAIDPEFDQWRQANEIAGTSEVGKGWRSAGLGSRAAALYTQSLKAANEGDAQNAEVLRQQAEDLDQQTAAWAPRVQNVSDVRSLRDAADWAAGALGNVRTSVAPALASLAGAGVGLVAAPFTAGVVNPVNAGFAGGAIAGYDAETEEAVAAAMRDPYIMANHTPAEILAASRIKGGLNSLLEAAVPTVMGGKVMGTMGKGAVGKFFGRAATKAELTAAQAAERAGQRAIVDGGRMGAAKAVGASTFEGGVGEFGTEFTQNLTGQGTQNYLQDKGVTDDLDYMQALNEGAAGAVPGGGMGIVGGGGKVARAHMASTKDAVAKVARDPVGAAADFVADAGHTAGEVTAKLTAALERLASPDQRAFDTLLSAATPEQHAAAATQWAQHVLNDKDSREADRAAAADYVTRVANGDPKAASVYRDQLTVAHHEGLVAEALGGLADEIEERQPKQSRENMTVAGDLSSRLAELWLGSEGKGIGLFKKAGGTSEAKRAALMLTEWVRSGFGAAHNDGETFVPKRLIEDLGDDAPKVVLSLAKLVKKQGVFTGDDASILKMHDEVKALSQDNSTDTNIIDQMLTPLAHAHWNDSKTNVVAKALRESNGKVSEGQRKALEESFGPNTDAVLKHFREKAVTPKYGKQLEVEAGAPSIDEEGTVSASTDDYESGLSETTPASKVRFQGVGANNVPFNTLYADKKASHDTLLSTYKNQQGAYARSVGVHDALKEQYGKDHPYMREAENEALWNAVKKVKSSNAERDAYMTHLESLTPEQRDSQLKALNKTHKLLRVEEQGGNEAADKITPDKVEGFREKRGARSEKVTPADGVLYLERKTQTDKESGEQTGVDEDFLTSTHRLIQHTYDTENRESEGRTKGSAGRGVKGEYEALLRGLAALVESDGTFTGRVGFRTTPESEVVYRASTDKLPKQLKLRSGTVEDANARAKSEMKAGQPMNFTLREVVSNGAKREELRRLSNTKNISYPLKQEVDAVLASKSGASVETLYDRLYSEWNKADAELGEVIPETTDKDLTPTEFANEPEMHRDSDGQRKGLGVDASGYEGASRGGRTTDVVDARGAVKLEAESRPADEPARKKVRKLGDQLDARDWVADLLRKGIPAFNAALLKYAKDADVMKRVKAGIRVLTQMAPRGLIDVYDGNLTVAQAETIISRAKKAMGVSDVRNNDAGVETEVRGRVDAVGRQGTEEAGAAPDKRGSAPKAELGKSLGLGGILSTKELDDAIYDENYGKLDSVAKLQQFATYTRDLATRLEAREEAGEELSKRDEGLSSLAGQLVFEAKSFIKNPNRTGIDFDSFFDDIKHTDEDVSAFVKALAGVKQSTQTADITGKQGSVSAGGVKQSRMSADIHTNLGKPGFAATHDSPIRHEGRFDWRKNSGKGEGNAAFGAGTYLSTADGVHRSYKEQFTTQMGGEKSFTWGGSEFSLDGDSVYKDGDTTMTSAEESIAYAILNYGMSPSDSLDYAAKVAYHIVDRSAEDIGDHISVSEPDVSDGDLNYVLKSMRERKTMDPTRVVPTLEPFFNVDRWNKIVVAADKKAAELRKVDVSGIRTKLSAKSPTYHVSVNAQQDELLDWDKPISEQSDFIKKALKASEVLRTAAAKMPRRTQLQIKLAEKMLDISDQTGAEVYTKLKLLLGSQAKVSDHLQSLGIVGHRYASLGGKNDSHPNYVIYDDSRIDTNYVHFNAQTADITGKRATKAEKDAAMQHILDTIGDTVKSAFVNHFGDNSSGSWTPGETQNVIRLALNGNVLSTSYHESMHEFFAMLKKYGNTATVKLLERVASNEILNRKLERLLADHPEAAAQVRESPEEAAVFLYQFWRAGQVKLGEETTGFFQKIKNLFSKITGKVSQLKLDEQAAQRVLEAFSRGDFKSMNGDTAVRDASMEALRKDTAMHEKVLDNLDKAGRDFTRIAGKLFFSSEAMLKGTKNKYMVGVAELLHQETGTARGENQGLLSAVRQHSDIWLNKLNNILTKYKSEDLELARQALSKGVPARDRIAKEIVEKINAFNEEMYTYISSRDVRRLDPDTNKWVKVERRKDYFTRVWDTNAIQSRTAEFKELLFKHHRADLEATAKIANNEVAAFMKGDATFKDLGPAANTAVQQGFSDLEAAGKAMGRVDTHTVTAEMVADAIITRLLNAKGHADLDEGGSDIGMTPLATSVNRRSLSWINDKHFDDFKSKDITNIMTSYVSSMVKRAEYTKALGHGSEKLRTGVDKAILYEMGGDELVKNAERRLPIAIRAWGRAKAAALKAGEEFTVPYPTLRSVGLVAHNVTVSSEQVHKDLAAALKHLDQGFKAIQAQEGTLGSNISAGMKSVNNVLMTYQTVRLLPLVMFSSVNDVMGIVAQGGELKDAWDALVGGMREIKLRWKDEKSQDYKALRAEGWGTVDAGSLWDTLGQAYGSSYMSDAARKFADGFFKWNGMEGWNRAMRITATSVAERALKAYQKVGFDKNDKAAKARFEELYGKNFDPKDIALDADGELDMNDVNNQAAMMRWVSSAIMSPNAAHRTTWGSDPHMASFWMLKQFAYTFHRVMLKGAIEQAKLGNYRPAVVLALGYAPVTIAADAVKEMLIPGEEPPWMQGGLDGFLAHGFDRAGVAGVPGMAYDALTSFNGPVLGSLSAMGGPTVGQLTSALVDSPSSTLLGAAPFGSLLRRAAE